MEPADILAGLEQWRRANGGVPDEFKDLISLNLESSASPQHAPTEIFEQWLESHLAQLAHKQPALAQLIRLRFVDDHKIETTAHKLDMSVATFYRRLPEATQGLAHTITAAETAARQRHYARLYKRLDAPLYDRLFGREDAIQQLLDLLLDQATLPIISVEGMGGLGKTTLLDAVAREAIRQERFFDIGWASARTHQFDLHHRIETLAEPSTTTALLIEHLARQLLGADAISLPFDLEEIVLRLQGRFKNKPHLIVLDNLETLADPQKLVEILLEWAGPTVFLLSSRRRLLQQCYPYTIPELPQVDALELIRYRARQANISQIADAEDHLLHPIYEHVGGNPLALLLVVGQLQHMGLSRVLESLRKARGRSISELYTYIYHQAWQQLSDDARKIWIGTLFLSGDKDDFDHLVDTSGLDSQQVQDGLEELVRWHLVNHHRGATMDESFYTIHSLTATFLLEEIHKWEP